MTTPVSKSYYFKDAPKASQFKKSSNAVLSGAKKLSKMNLLKAAKFVGRRTTVGKAVLAGVAAYGIAKGLKAQNEGIKKYKDKKKVQKKSTGGEIIIGRGVDLDLL